MGSRRGPPTLVGITSTQGFGRAPLPRGIGLAPAGSLLSEAHAVGAGRQGGFVDVGGLVYHASLWSSTPTSIVDLNPTNATQSRVYAMSDFEQAGYALVDGAYHASLWSGTAESWIDLNPTGVPESLAFAVRGGQQAGWARVGGVIHASVWRGTAASWVDLHPTNSTESSAAAVDGEHQAGYATLNDELHASLWSGTAASWVDLDPAGSTESQAYAISGGQQSGHAVVGGVTRASMWTGTAASWVDLHALLPAGFTFSVARGLSNDGTHLFITGNGINSLTGYTEALLWTLPIASLCYANCDGSTTPPVLTANDFQCFLNSFAFGQSYANCDRSTVPPVLNANDFQCFLNAYAADCP